MVTGVTQMPQQEDDEDDEDEETGEKFEFDDSEDEHHTVERKEPEAPHVEAKRLESADPNALYCQSMKRVTQHEMNGGTSAGLEDRDIPTQVHVTCPGYYEIYDCIYEFVFMYAKLFVCQH